MVEERWKEQVLGTGAEASGEAYLFQGMDSRATLCIAPELQSYIAEEFRKESAALKERRKAREERALAKPK
eukprot:9589641-Lingulodinium_polyedra.AAC.1